jgi:hypothetical protein
MTSTDLDALDRLINDTATSTASPIIRRSPRRSPKGFSKLALDCNAITPPSSSPPTSSAYPLINNAKISTTRNNYKCHFWSTLLALLTKAVLVGAAIKLVIKPDFCLTQSHSHDQSRFLRGNNILLNDSPFRPRFVNKIYGGDEDAEDEESAILLDEEVTDSTKAGDSLLLSSSDNSEHR